MTIEVVGYTPAWRADFAALNREWVERWFTVEPADEAVFNDPEGAILAGGGHILMALSNGVAIGTVALIHEGDGVYELSKMAVAPAARGTGVGRLLMQACLDLYRTLDGTTLFLETNSRLAPAIALYESVGFEHQPAVRDGSHYSRADTYMIWRG